MSRFFVPPEAINGNNIVISKREAHHILDVLRLKVSDSVIIFDGTGKEYAGIIKEASRNSLTVEIKEVRENAQKGACEITLLQALTKKDKMDYIIEKATELGARRIAPVFTARTIPDWDEAKKRAQAQRWTKIALEAAKQCGRADIPEVSAVTGFTDAIKGFDDFDMRLIAVLSEDAVPLKDALAGSRAGKAVIAIGPEGDFTPDESTAAKSCGFRPVSLGPRVLKSDTAGLALLSILNYELSS